MPIQILVPGLAVCKQVRSINRRNNDTLRFIEVFVFIKARCGAKRAQRIVFGHDDASNAGDIVVRGFYGRLYRKLVTSLRSVCRYELADNRKRWNL